MTEAEWLTTTDPSELLEHVRGIASERSLRLFECACCRRVWDQLTDVRSRIAVEVAEKFADGLTSDAELEEASHQAELVPPPDGYQYLPGKPLPVTDAAYNVAIPMGWWGGAPAFESPSSIVQNMASDSAAERESQVSLVRDIFGNPFIHVPFPQDWRTETVVKLSRRMYDSRDFSAIPTLGSALEAAGCTNDSILSHCRNPGPHVRGCWVVDLVLGLE